MTEEVKVTESSDTFQLVRTLFKNDWNEPFELKEGQREIFDCIFTKGVNVNKNRIHIMTYTQYGKSDVTAMAVLLRVATFAEKWVIVAPSQSKARIIMGYLIKHLFENEYTMDRFKVKEGESVDQIRRERSKNRLTFDVGNNQVGELFILSAESKIKSEDVGNALMGFGAPNLLMDEAALIGDEADAKAMRMVGGFTDAGLDFVVKIGNPFKRNHFLAAFEDPNYYKINIDWQRGVREGRLSAKYMEEMSKKPFFNVLYENSFPASDDIDRKGWTQLLSEEEIRMAQTWEEITHIGERRIGNDVARGGANDTVWCLRSMNYAEILAKSRQDNLTDIAAQTLYFMKENNVTDQNVFIDSVGVGGGAVDPLKYEGKNVNAINVGETALEDSKYANKRAEAYWRLREWIKKGGKLSKSDDWFQLCKVKYKPDSKGRLRIISKDEMRAQGIDSPDVADSLMLSFVRKENNEATVRIRKKREEKRRMRKEAAGRGLHLSMGGY